MIDTNIRADTISLSKEHEKLMKLPLNRLDEKEHYTAPTHTNIVYRYVQMCCV